MRFRDIEQHPFGGAQSEIISEDFALRGQQGAIARFAWSPIGRRIRHQTLKQG